MIEDSRLKIFMTVAELGGFTLAAKQLGVTQPAVSQNIAELEKILGVELFIRARGSVTLTDAGETFKEYASRILYWYSAAEELFGDAGKMTFKRPIRIAADSASAEGIVPKLAAKVVASGSSASFIVAGENEDYDLRISVSKPSDTLSLGTKEIIAGTDSAAVISESSALGNMTSLEEIPSKIKFAVWKPYLEILPPDITARACAVSDFPETIVRLVKNSSEIVGLVPSSVVPDELNILPIQLHNLDFDVIFEAKPSFRKSDMFNLLQSLVKTI